MSLFQVSAPSLLAKLFPKLKWLSKTEMLFCQSFDFLFLRIKPDLRLTQFYQFFS